MSFRYGFDPGSRDLIEDELGFSQDELDVIEDETGLSLSDTFDRIEETEFRTREGGQTTSTGRAVTRPEEGLEGTDVVLEYEEVDAGTLAHEATHATMMQPDGMVVSDLPEDSIASQRLYGEFVAHVAEHRVEPLATGGTDVQKVWQTKKTYEETIDEDIDAVYDAMVEGEAGLSREERAAAMEYQDVREQDLAAVAAEAYCEDHDPDMRAFVSPDEELYRETMDYIENVEDHILEYA